MDNNMNGGMMKEEGKACGSCGKSSCGSCGKGGSGCKCPHHKIPVLAVLLIGVAFLGKALGWWSAETVDWVWPALIIVGAGIKLTGSKCKCC